MSIEDINTRGDLAAFIQQQLDASRIGGLIRQLQGRLTVGQDTFSFVANNDTSTVVQHGLGTTPTAISIEVNASGTNSQMTGWSDLTETTFTAHSRREAGVTTDDFTFTWVAVA